MPLLPAILKVYGHQGYVAMYGVRLMVRLLLVGYNRVRREPHLPSQTDAGCELWMQVNIKHLIDARSVGGEIFNTVHLTKFELREGRRNHFR